MKRFLIITVLVVVATPVALALSWYLDRQSERKEFYLAFGEYPDNHAAAQLAVQYQLYALVMQACECAKQWQVFPTDNYSLEVSYWSNIRRLEAAEKLAVKRGYEIPREIAQFRDHPQWEKHAKYSELRCFDESR